MFDLDRPFPPKALVSPRFNPEVASGKSPGYLRVPRRISAALPTLSRWKLHSTSSRLLDHVGAGVGSRRMTDRAVDPEQICSHALSEAAAVLIDDMTHSNL
jgi:hypothetical protein